MPAPQIIHDLIERFERNHAAYMSGSYNETQARREFIDPFFEALGWDLNNREGYAEAYKDVIHEDAVKVGGITKAPDYSFRIGGTRKFFVEAKKPSICVKDDPAPAFQVRRYAWSAKLPLSIVTDFEEFAVYDCRVKPDQNDRADKARVKYYTFRQYAEKWDEIAAIFSRNAILMGSFDKYAESNKIKRGTSEVDNAFLEEIEGWRETLAKNIALRNTLTVRDLNEAVQRTIDRIIFLRIAEDRGIEEYGSLRGICNGPNTFIRLRELFYKADERYNSGIFHFRHEKGEAEPPDSLTISLVIDDKPLKDILKRLYYPDSPYEFSVLPADILGQVYEQFLGKVIRLTSGHRPVIEDKPEVKKAGGVFYTPTYIVDYIVRNTVGALLGAPRSGGASAAPTKPITPNEAAKLRILDPACGSGSFLLGAYQYLLDWHLTWYVDNSPEKWAKARKPVLHQGKGGAWHLTTAERKRILLNNIFGVDIDSQAVEVTKLSLLLKVLEGETGETLNQQVRLFHERALPDLGSNIKCGNSLIGSDFYDGKQLSLLDDEEKYRVNCFDWQREFAEVFSPQRQIPLNPPLSKGDSSSSHASTPPFGKGGPGGISIGGFDAVIGNPPYIRIQALKEYAPQEGDFYKLRYDSAKTGNYDIYVVFVEKGLQLLNKNGKLSYILPHKFFNTQYGEPLRKIIADGKYLEEVVHFGHQQVFKGATTYTCLLSLGRGGSDNFGFFEVSDLLVWAATGLANSGTLAATEASSADWNFTVGAGGELFEKLRDFSSKLGDVAARMAQGIRTSANEVYVLDKLTEKGDIITAYSKQLNREVELERNAVCFFLQGREIKSYRIQPSGKIVLVPYRMHSRKSVLLTKDEMTHCFPKAWSYLLENKTHLENREKGKFSGTGWYGYGRLQNIDLMLLSKILVPDIADRASFALDEAGEYAFTSGYGITLKQGVDESPKFVLGLLNSRVLDYYLKKISTVMRGGFFRYFTQYIEQIPIRRVDFANPTDKASHDRMVQLVEQMLDLNKQLPDAKTGHEKTHIQRQLDATDRQIDRLVYELYGLTEEEIAVVEG